MTKPLVFFGLLCALCWGLLIYVFSLINSTAIEEVNDPAWVCTALEKSELLGLDGEAIGNIAKGDTLHLLASSHDKRDLVMVQTTDGTRGWVRNNILPNYYKIRSIDVEEPAHFHSKTFEEKIIGQDFTTLEEKYAAALQIVPKKKTKKNPDENGFSAIFPMKVITKGSRTVSQYATIQFEDGKAVAVEIDSVYEKKAARAKIDPLIFISLDKGILAKAGQQAIPTYTSYLPEGVENKSEDSWAEKIGKLLLILVLLILLAAFPILLISPLVIIIFYYIDDPFYRYLLIIPLRLVAIVLFFTAYAIVNTASILLLIFNIIALVGMIFYCINEVY